MNPFYTASAVALAVLAAPAIPHGAALAQSTSVITQNGKTTLDRAGPEGQTVVRRSGPWWDSGLWWGTVPAAEAGAPGEGPTMESDMSDRSTTTSHSAGSSVTIEQDGALIEERILKDADGQVIVRKSGDNAVVVIQQDQGTPAPGTRRQRAIERMLDDMSAHHADGPFKRFIDEHRSRR